MRGALPVLAVLALSTGACTPSRAESPPATAPVTATTRPLGPATVVVLGDSISRLSEPAIDAALADGYEVVHTSRDGKTLADQTSRAALHAPGGAGRQADAMLIELGTNDVIGASPNPVRDLRRLADTVAEVPCVVWYSVASVPLRADLTRVAEQLNGELRRLARGRPNFSFSDLIGRVYGRPGAIGPTRSTHSQGQPLPGRAYGEDLRQACELEPQLAGA
ncbi:MAG: SGNH/GDSL hydrolase family protein [Acidimicrobiales bacterium]